MLKLSLLTHLIRFLALIFITVYTTIEISAENISVVKSFGDNLSLWASTKSFTSLNDLETLCSKSPSFRIGNTLMLFLADKNNLAKTDTYDWDSYIACLQKEIDRGIEVYISEITSIPENYLEYNYPGLTYVSCKVKLKGEITYESKDLFILKNGKIVKVTDFKEKIDETTGTKKIDVDYLDLARCAFSDGDYEKTYQLYKQGGLKKIITQERKGNRVSSYDIIPYIESCIALEKWNDAMFGITDNHRITNRKTWINGTQWTLNPEDIRYWSKSKEPLMNFLLETLFNYYRTDLNKFRTSPTISHVVKQRNLNLSDLEESASNFFWNNRKYLAGGVFAAAEFGNKDAQKLTGLYYLIGHNLDNENPSPSIWVVPKDTTKAVRWLSKAALQGETGAGNIAAHYLLTGKGISRDCIQAYSLYTACYDSFDFDNIYGLGICNYYGLGKEVDLVKAYEYLKDVEDWHPGISYLIGNLCYSDNNSDAIPYFKRALTTKNIPDAMVYDILSKLSHCYQNGLCGCSLNINEARRLYEEASRYKNTNPNDIQEYFISLTLINVNNAE